MSGLNAGFSEKIDAWNSNEEETDGCSHNMLRILENKIINTSRTQHIFTKHKNINLKTTNVVRPATVRVKPVSSTKIARQTQQKRFESCNRFELGKISKERKFSEKLQSESIEYKCSLEEVCFKKKCQVYEVFEGEKASMFSSKMRNKSVENMKRERSMNKENAIEKEIREAERQIQKEEMEMKKQSLIFTYCSLRNKKESNISKLHEMEVKLRNNKVKNGSSMASHRKVNIIIERKNEIKFNGLSLGITQKFGEELNPHVPEREIGYSGICRRVKVMVENEEEDVFADTHLSDALVNSKFNN